MEAAGFTSSFEGIIRGAQVAKEGSNPRKLIVILSDGNDYGERFNDINDFVNYENQYLNYIGMSDDIHKNMLNDNYCETIRDQLGKEVATVNNQKISVKPRMAVIGIDYDVEKNENLKHCVGEDNVYSAKSMDAVYDRLVELISEEVGRIYTDTTKYEESMN